MVKKLTPLASALAKCLLCLITILLAGSSVFATSDNYYFGTYTGVALEDLSTDATDIFGTPSGDDGNYLYNIGFNFKFAGEHYSTFSISSSALPSFYNKDQSESQDRGASGNIALPPITALWNDQDAANNGSVRYKLIGVAPNRKLVVEWSVRNCCNSYYDKTFQVWFNENRTVQFVYGGGAAPTDPAIGLIASGNDFLTLAIGLPSDYSNSEEYYNIWPRPGQAYTFSSQPLPGRQISYTSR